MGNHRGTTTFSGSGGGGGKPSLQLHKGDDGHHLQYQQQQPDGRYESEEDWEEESDGEEGSGDDFDADCPLCLEEMDEGDQHFKPCPCGYQVCRFCYHKIREEGNEKCPACRRIYTDEDVVWKVPETTKPKIGKKVAPTTAGKNIKTVGKGGKKAAKPASEAASTTSPNIHHHGILANRKHLAELRVIQRNLVYVIGISARIASEGVLKEPEYFGQYGRILKIVVNKKNLSSDGMTTTSSSMGMTSSSIGPSASAYVTFVRKEDAAKAIAGIDGSLYDGRVIRATYGTTKYCSFYLKGMACTNAGCMYLHEEGEDEDSFTKDELNAGYSKMHLHSYIPDKTEAAGMRQFGTLQTPQVAAAQRPTSPPVSRPMTPVLQQPSPKPPLFDKTPKSFFERLYRLAAPQLDEDFLDLPRGDSPSPPHHPDDLACVTPPGLLPSYSPTGFRRRPTMVKFDPFNKPEDSFAFHPTPVASTINPNANRPVPPPPIGSPIGFSLKTRSQSGFFPAAAESRTSPPLFSESISLSSNIRSKTVDEDLSARSPIDGIFSKATTAANPASSMFSFLSASDDHPQQQAKPMEPSVEKFFNLFSSSSTAQSSTTATNPASLFEDPAIMQARLHHQPKQPSSAPVPKVVKTAMAETANPSGSAKSQPMKKAKQSNATSPSSPSSYTTENAFAPLVSSSSKKPAAPTPTGIKKRPTATGPTGTASTSALPNDPAIVSTTSANPQPVPPQPYHRIPTVPPLAQLPSELLQPLPASPTPSLHQYNTHISALQSAMYDRWKESGRLDEQMLAILGTASTGTIGSGKKSSSTIAKPKSSK